MGDMDWGCGMSQHADAGAGVRAERISPVEFFERQVLAAGVDALAGLFPEFGWRRHAKGWVATNDAECHARLGCAARRVYALAAWRDGLPRGVTVMGDAGVAGRTRVVGWLELWARTVGTPHGPAYTRAVVELARALSIDTGPLEGRAETTAERATREAAWAQRDAARAAEHAAAMERDRAERAVRIAAAQRIWDSAQGSDKIADDCSPAWQYLQARVGLWPDTGADGHKADVCRPFPPLPASIRCLTAVESVQFEYPSSNQAGEMVSLRVRGPALVARVHDRGGATMAVKIILLKTAVVDGHTTIRKRSVERNKPNYGVMRLEGRGDERDGGRAGYTWIPQRLAETEQSSGQTEDASGGWTPHACPVALCEGLETGWAIHLATGWPVMVCWDAGGLAAADVSHLLGASLATSIVIAGDHDSTGTGRKAAEACAQRLVRAHPGLDVRVAIPDDERWSIERADHEQREEAAMD